MPRTEKTFQSEIRKSIIKQIKSPPWWYRKIPDLGFRNPFDALLVHKGIAYAMEYKMLKNSQTVNLHTLFSKRAHEVMHLETFHHSGGKSFVIINVYKKGSWNYCLLLEWTQVCALFNSHDGRMKISQLQDYRMERFNGSWDIMSMIERDYDRENRAWIDISLNRESKHYGFRISDLPIKNENPLSEQTSTDPTRET